MGKKLIEIGKEDALIVVDGQNDFLLVNGALHVAGIVGECHHSCIISDIKVPLWLLPFGHKATTEDDHSEGHIEFGLFGRHCPHGTDGQKYYLALMPEYNSADEHIKKGQDPALISLSIYASPQFGEHVATLRRKSIKRIFIVGWAYNLCVCRIAITYAVQGFEVYVIRDLCRSVPPPFCGKYNTPELARRKMRLDGIKEIYLKGIE